MHQYFADSKKAYCFALTNQVQKKVMQNNIQIFEIEFQFNGEVIKTTRVSINGSDIFVGFPQGSHIVSVIAK